MLATTVASALLLFLLFSAGIAGCVHWKVVKIRQTNKNLHLMKQLSSTCATSTPHSNVMPLAIPIDQPLLCHKMFMVKLSSEIGNTLYLQLRAVYKFLYMSEKMKHQERGVCQNQM